MSSRIKKYLHEQPHTPEGLKYRVPILVSDSKGYTLRNHCQDFEFPLECWCHPGARTRQLVDIIEARIRKAIQRHKNIIIYLWAGTCDITYKKGKYIFLRHQSEQAVEDILKQYQRAINIIARYKNAELKLIDCPFLSISNWNTSKGHPEPESFKESDLKVTNQIKSLNKGIWKLNSRLGKVSIRVSQYFIKRRKTRARKARTSVNLNINSKDGVHPGELLSLAISKNILLDTYQECYHIIKESEHLQIRVEKEELLSLF